MSNLIKINEGEVIASDKSFGIRVSKNRVSYSERGKTIASFDVEHTANPYLLHLYIGSLAIHAGQEAAMERKEYITKRVRDALNFLGCEYIIE